ncbi:hypothetical protein [Glutamicibacter arilaitensis]|uniref:hypothetical protein n=1 Tax=Glutamicibacter arilaitensis TaxID=256701 RepID=UPI00384E0976
MAELSGQDPVTKLEAENVELRQKVFIGESIIEELRQALSSSQVAQAKANALLKLANQPTA